MVHPKVNHNQSENGETPLEAVVDEAIKNSNNGKVALGDLLHAWGDRSYGPLFILLGFVAGTPLAIVPGAAAVVGVIIFILAIQMALGKVHPWLPNAALRQSISEKSLRKTREKAASFLFWLDHIVKERMIWASREITRRISAVLVSILGVLMIPFDAIPFAVAAPAWTVVIFGLAITARDGLVMILGAVACAGVAVLGLSAI
jgi:hypothetical protein